MVSQNLNQAAAQSRLPVRNILIGISAGIAAYKIQFLIRMLRRAGSRVRVVVTEHAEQFVTPLSLETLSGEPVYRELFAPRDKIAHISLREWADLLVIAPLTANLAGKLANGIADDLLTTTALGWEKPRLLCPAMNDAMYRAAPLQRNLAQLQQDGWQILGPAAGELACGSSGAGRMVEPEEIFERIAAMTGKVQLPDKKIVITAGACRQPLDPVRFISNRSTGRMGAALATAALERYGRVTVIAAAVECQFPSGVTLRRVETTAEMLAAVTEELQDAAALIMAAAVADYQVKEPAAQKLKKEKNSGLTLELSPTPDILKETAQLRRRNGVYTVGFAMESEQLTANARRKLLEKELDGIAANPLGDPQAGFAVDTNRIHYLSVNSEGGVEMEEWPLLSKLEAGARIVERTAAGVTGCSEPMTGGCDDLTRR